MTWFNVIKSDRDCEACGEEQSILFNMGTDKDPIMVCKECAQTFRFGAKSNESSQQKFREEFS